MKCKHCKGTGMMNGLGHMLKKCVCLLVPRETLKIVDKVKKLKKRGRKKKSEIIEKE